MSLITIVKRRLRAARIRMAEEDLAYSREAADTYLAAEAARINRMRIEHDKRTSEEIRRDVERAAKRLGLE